MLMMMMVMMMMMVVIMMMMMMMVDDNHGDDHDDGAPPWGPGGPRCCFDLTAISERATSHQIQSSGIQLKYLKKKLTLNYQKQPLTTL